jgi:hypothetical protein
MEHGLERSSLQELPDHYVSIWSLQHINGLAAREGVL